MFDYDWFHGPGYEQQKQEARRRCALHRFPDMDPEVALGDVDVLWTSARVAYDAW